MNSRCAIPGVMCPVIVTKWRAHDTRGSRRRYYREHHSAAATTENTSLPPLLQRTPLLHRYYREHLSAAARYYGEHPPPPLLQRTLLSTAAASDKTTPPSILQRTPLRRRYYREHLSPPPLLQRTPLRRYYKEQLSTAATTENSTLPPLIQRTPVSRRRYYREHPTLPPLLQRTHISAGYGEPRCLHSCRQETMPLAALPTRIKRCCTEMPSVTVTHYLLASKGAAQRCHQWLGHTTYSYQKVLHRDAISDWDTLPTRIKRCCTEMPSVTGRRELVRRGRAIYSVDVS